MNPSNPEFTILMPCLNEAATLPLCIQEIQDYLISASLSAEILIADNGSTDDSPALAEALGARVINVSKKAMEMPCLPVYPLRKGAISSWVTVTAAMISPCCPPSWMLCTTAVT